jgi:hypothetical protein
MMQLSKVTTVHVHAAAVILRPEPVRIFSSSPVSNVESREAGSAEWSVVAEVERQHSPSSTACPEAWAHTVTLRRIVQVDECVSVFELDDHGRSGECTGKVGAT